MATRLPSGSYRTQVFIGYDEKTHRRMYKSFTASTAKAADLLALQWQAEHPSAGRANESLLNCISSYLSSKTEVLSPSTVRGYTIMYNVLRREYPKLCAKKLDLITGDDLQGLVNAIYKKRSSKTARNYYFFLRSVYSHKGIDIPFVTCLPA